MEKLLKGGTYMETSNMKNMVVLKNLPSNLVEEAIIILKSSKKVKRLQKIEKKNKIEKKETIKQEDYVLKEAEMIVASYLSKLENNREQKQYKTIKNHKKYNRLKSYAFLTSIIVVIQALMLIAK